MLGHAAGVAEVKSTAAIQWMHISAYPSHDARREELTVSKSSAMNSRCLPRYVIGTPSTSVYLSGADVKTVSIADSTRTDRGTAHLVSKPCLSDKRMRLKIRR